MTLYPFILMDVPAGNTLPDPYGGAAQAAYPWRGRITCTPAPGQSGTADKTSAAASQLSALFGAAGAGDFTVSGGEVDYHGPDEWGFRRFILANAHLAEAAGGVDGFLIGSELRGVTTVRSDASTFPAVAALRTLAADCASVLRAGTQIGYAADWTEYNGHQPADGTGDVFFHLDPLWADDHVSFVGVDWYAPLADWRDGDTHLDALAGYGGPYDHAYLAANVAGGEGYDFYYASDAARSAQTRSPITDGAYGEPWVFRPKDLQNWWSHAHHDRPGGVRSTTPTAWTPGAKPIRVVEFGCPAVNKGSNAPNRFVDPKSAESSLPPFSDGSRDDLAQRRALEALLVHYADAAANPVSTVYGAPMVDVDAMAAWCWDARPFPDFPARTAVWADAANWRLGHWLNGRMGSSEVSDLITALMLRAGIGLDAFDPSGAPGLVDGYLLDRPMSTASALAPLTDTFAFDMAERGGLIAAMARDGAEVTPLGADTLALQGAHADHSLSRVLKPLLDAISLRFIDGAGDYKTGGVTVRGEAGGGGAQTLDLPLVISADTATRAGARRLRRLAAECDTATAYVSPLAALEAEPGDVVSLDDGVAWRVTRVDADETPRLALARVEAADAGGADGAVPVTGAPARPLGPPALYLLDLPLLEGMEDDTRPLAAISADPWGGFDLSAGPSDASLTLRASAADPATVGLTLNDLAAGPLHRFDRATRLGVQVEGGVLASASEDAVLNGANALAVLCGNGEWELIQYLNADLVAPGAYVLSGLLRGQAGSDGAMRAGAAAGAPVVILNTDVVRASVSLSERGLPLLWRAAPSGGPAGGVATTEVGFTWTALALRPFSPCHLSLVTLSDGTLRFGWTRRTRVGGDPWAAGDVPLSEVSESYRLDVFNGGVLVRSLSASSPTVDYAPAVQTADFPGGVTRPLTVEVRQGSDAYGWGAPLRRSL